MKRLLAVSLAALTGAVVLTAFGSAAPAREAGPQAAAAPTALKCTIRGTRKNDVLSGTRKADVICGLAGNDTIRGRQGNDVLVGGPGNDVLVGGTGNDLMNGGAGNDAFFARGDKIDRISGGKGRDRAVVDKVDRVVGVEVVQRPTTTSPAKLPPLPADIRNRKRWIIGVKCDAPPFGYIDVRGKNAGFDVEIARWFARYAFGNANRITYECTPTPAREPALTTGRVDMVIATFTYTRDRDTRIDFSKAYYKATGRLLVKNNSPVQKLDDIKGRTVVTTSGSIYDRWIRRCFPTTKLIVTDNFTNAALAFNQGRADALMWDDTVLVGIAANDRNSKLTNDTFLALPYGIGIRQGNTALQAWVDARLELMRKNDLFLEILENNVPSRFVSGFSRNILRPNNTFDYAPESAPAPDTVCP